MNYPECLINQFKIQKEDKFRSKGKGVNENYDMVRVTIDINIVHWRLLKNIINARIDSDLNIIQKPFKVYLLIFEDGWECRIEGVFLDVKTANTLENEYNGFDEEGNPLEGPYSVRSMEIEY